MDTQNYGYTTLYRFIFLYSRYATLSTPAKDIDWKKGFGPEWHAAALVCCASPPHAQIVHI